MLLTGMSMEDFKSLETERDRSIVLYANIVEVQKSYDCINAKIRQTKLLLAAAVGLLFGAGALESDKLIEVIKSFI